MTLAYWYVSAIVPLTLLSVLHAYGTGSLFQSFLVQCCFWRQPSSYRVARRCNATVWLSRLTRRGLLFRSPMLRRTRPLASASRQVAPAAGCGETSRADRHPDFRQPRDVRLEHWPVCRSFSSHIAGNFSDLRSAGVTGYNRLWPLAAPKLFGGCDCCVRLFRLFVCRCEYRQRPPGVATGRSCVFAARIASVCFSSSCSSSTSGGGRGRGVVRTPASLPHTLTTRLLGVSLQLHSICFATHRKPRMM